MLPWRRGLFLAAAFLFALVALMPLRLVLEATREETGLTARAVDGSLWLGRLTDARFGAAALGDLDVELSMLPLFIGEVRLTARNEQLRGTAVLGRRRGVAGLTGRAEGTLARLPIRVVEFVDATILFAGAICADADGLVRAWPGDAVAMLGISGPLEGRLRCQGSILQLPLASTSGRERLDLRIDSQGRYTGSLSVRPEGLDAAALLSAAGFTAQAEDFLLPLEGVL